MGVISSPQLRDAHQLWTGGTFLFKKTAFLLWTQAPDLSKTESKKQFESTEKAHPLSFLYFHHGNEAKKPTSTVV
jgi:hypothetical protein